MTLKSVFFTFVWIVFFLVISYFIGGVTRDNMDWYDTLIKSPLNPPRIVFPIVWTALYILLAIAGSRLWNHTDKPQGIPLFMLFGAYMLMNWAWSFVFFSGHMIAVGFAWIVVSDVLLGVLIFMLWRRRLYIDSALLMPTFLWGLFAAYLNGYIAFAA